MSNFSTLLAKETVSTIEGLLGETPTVSLKTSDFLNEFSAIVPPVALITITVAGDRSGTMAMLVPPGLATAMADKMVGGDGTEKETMDADDLDAAKEIASNVFGALGTTMGAQKELPKLSFTVSGISFVDENGSVDLSPYEVLTVFDFGMGALRHSFMLLTDKNLSFLVVERPPSETQAAESHAPAAPVAGEMRGNVTLGSDEMKNIALLLDVKLTVRVRIGVKKMLLRDVINMDIGSIIELEQLANEPLDILVEGKKVAEGEVVIVDGNFGIQITSIGSKRERLEQLKN